VANALPEAFERRLGDAVRGQVLGLLARIEHKDPGAMVCGGGARPLERTAERLAGYLDIPPAVRVSVVDAKIKNAMALPGGHILIFLGSARCCWGRPIHGPPSVKPTPPPSRY
jgi:hypothetical protein